MLTGKKIEECVRSGLITITPFNKENVNPNSYDLTLDGRVIYISNNRDFNNELITCEFTIPEEGMFLRKNNFYLLSTIEVAGSNHFVPCIAGKSSLARMGLSVHEAAGFGDTGFIGTWTLEVFPKLDILVKPGMRICQVYFVRPEGEITLYEGKYLNQRGVTKSKVAI